MKQNENGKAAFGNDSGTLYLDASNPIDLCQLQKKPRWKRQLRKSLKRRPLVWFVDDESKNRRWFAEKHRGHFGVLTFSNFDHCNRSFQEGTPCDIVVTDIFFPANEVTSKEEAEQLLDIYNKIDETPVSGLHKLWDNEKQKWSLKGFDIARLVAKTATDRKEVIPVLLFSRKATLLLSTDDWIGEPPAAVRNIFWLLEKLDPLIESEPGRKAAAIQQDRIIAALRYKHASSPWWLKILAGFGLCFGRLSFDLGSLVDSRK